MNSDAWILLAVKLAIGNSDTADSESVIKAADFINHAKPTRAELEHADALLARLELVKKYGDDYRLGHEFGNFWTRSGASEARSVHRQLKLVESELNAYQDS